MCEQEVIFKYTINIPIKSILLDSEFYRTEQNYKNSHSGTPLILDDNLDKINNSNLENYLNKLNLEQDSFTITEEQRFFNHKTDFNKIRVEITFKSIEYLLVNTDKNHYFLKDIETKEMFHIPTNNLLRIFSV